MVWIWLLTTLVAVGVANAAVSSVRASVTDTPAPLGLPEADRITTPTSEVLDPMVPATVPRPATRAPDDPPSGGGGEEPATSASKADPTTTTTTTAPVSTPTTAPSPTASTTADAAGGQLSTYDTEGGWVTVLIDGDDVVFQAAGPAQGWKVEIESQGPIEVVVQFERRSGRDDEVTFHITIEGGKPKVEIDD